MVFSPFLGFLDNSPHLMPTMVLGPSIVTNLQTVNHCNDCTEESWQAAYAAEKSRYCQYYIVVWSWNV